MQSTGQFGMSQSEVTQFLGTFQSPQPSAEIGGPSSSSSSHAHHFHQQQARAPGAAGAQQETQLPAIQSQQQQEHLYHHLNLSQTAHHQQQHQVHQLRHQNLCLFQQHQNGFGEASIGSMQFGRTQRELHHLHQTVLHINSSPQAFSTPGTPITPTTTTPNTYSNPEPQPMPTCAPGSNPDSRFAQFSVVSTAVPIQEEPYDDGTDKQNMDYAHVDTTESGQRSGTPTEAVMAGGGSRWPRQEALALLKIRADMDAEFRNSIPKGPLWEEVSRKLAAMGYDRSAKKCKEKFENVHKYYKRTKDGKVGRQHGKSYRFFSQLEALYGSATTFTAEHSPTLISNKNIHPGILFLQSHLHDMNVTSLTGFGGGAVTTPLAQLQPREVDPPSAIQPLELGGGSPNRPLHGSDRSTSELNLSIDDASDDNDNSADDDDGDFENDGNCGNADGNDGLAHGAPIDGTTPSHSRKRKRKASSVPEQCLTFFETVMERMLQKQEEMYQNFLEALEKRESDRMIREEAWKRQEMAKLNREYELRARERTLAASRDATIVAFLQKVTGHSLQLPLVSRLQLPTESPPPAPPPTTSVTPFDGLKEDYTQHTDRELQIYDPNSKRWPKPEVLALINLRTTLDQKFHETGAKSQYWEEISARMAALGFNRSAKRCKEKWENINKYFKKAKESNKKRSLNSKSCPYYHHLDTLYREGVLGSSHSKPSLLETVVVDAPSEQQRLCRVPVQDQPESEAPPIVVQASPRDDNVAGMSCCLPELV